MTAIQPEARKPTDPAAGGVLSDFSRMKRDGSATLAELREFVSQLRGRSPQEVLGLISASQLVRSTALATIGCVVLMAILTIGPYLLGGNKPTKAPSAQQPAAPAPATQPVAEVSAGPTAAPAATDPTSSAASAAKVLKIDEAKPADPNVNPLDKDLDKLLDGEK